MSEVLSSSAYRLELDHGRRLARRFPAGASRPPCAVCASSLAVRVRGYAPPGARHAPVKP